MTRCTHDQWTAGSDGVYRCARCMTSNAAVLLPKGEAAPLTPDQLREAEALAVRECRNLARAFHPAFAAACVDCCREKAARIADDCPFMAQAKLALFGWVEP